MRQNFNFFHTVDDAVVKISCRLFTTKLETYVQLIITSRLSLQLHSTDIIYPFSIVLKKSPFENYKLGKNLVNKWRKVLSLTQKSSYCKKDHCFDSSSMYSISTSSEFKCILSWYTFTSHLARFLRTSENGITSYSSLQTKVMMHSVL